MSTVLALGAGFLLAVLWMDLMFDVQALRGPAGALPDDALASIAAYYHRVTTRARPMSYLIGLVMLVTVVGAVLRLWSGGGAPILRGAAVALCGVPIVTAQVRTFPNAVRLGARADPPDVQTALARAILRDHLVFFPVIAAFAAIQLLDG